MKSELELRKILASDLVKYSEYNLKIAAKNAPQESAGLLPFRFNKAQHYLHSRLEKQLKDEGHVRAIILKGRQQGCSTYTAARYYHKVTNKFGKKAYVIAHSADTTSVLFNMTKIYHEKANEFLKPYVSEDSRNSYTFGNMLSKYSVGTAGNANVGLGYTIHYLHGSEVAFWKNGAVISSGLVQAVPLFSGTEIIYESTANGRNNFFYQQWKEAGTKYNRFIKIFIPWFWQLEYSEGTVPKDFEPTKYENELKENYKLNDNQLVWRRFKVSEFGRDGANGELMFQANYPMSALDAFSINTTDSFIQDVYITRARKYKASYNRNSGDELIMGVDPARYGDDETAFIFRKGNKAFNLVTFSKKNNMEVVAMIARALEDFPDISKVYIDAAEGSGIHDRLCELGYNSKVYVVHFGGGSDDPKYMNKRGEMWGSLRKWLTGNVEIPDCDRLHEDLLSPRYTYQAENKILLEPKKDIKKRLKRSPDRGDALALTFANTGFSIESVTLNQGMFI